MKRCQPIIGFLLILFGFCLLIPATVTADGGFYPVAGLPVPDLPGQRALISYRDGVQTLVVESTVNDSSHVAWILPVPSSALSVKHGTVGLIKTLGVQLSPSLKHTDSFLLIFFGVCSAALYLLCLKLALGFTIQWKTILPALLIILFFLFLLVPNLVSYRGGADTTGAILDEVRVVQSERVGNYDTVVLEAASPAALQDWLRLNGFAEMDEGAEKIIDGYIRDGWHFLVSDLAGGSGRRLQPHPLEITFTAGQAVYPMRLTAIHSGSLLLDLFIIADAGATTRDCDLETIFRDRFVTMNKKEAEAWSMGKEGFQAESIYRYGKLAIAHPDAERFMWPGCWVTRLRGKVSPRHFTTDIRFDLEKSLPLVAYRQSTRAVITSGLAYCTLIFFTGLLLLIFLRNKGAANATCRLIGLAILPGTALLLLAALVWITESVPVRNSWERNNAVPELQNALSDLFALPPASRYTDEKLVSALHGSPRGEFVNRFTGQPVIVEDSPGNFTVHRKNGAISTVFVYHHSGAKISL